MTSNFILNNQNKKKLDPSDEPSEEDEDDPEGEECFSLGGIEMV